MSTDRTPIDRATEASFKAGAENAARELGLATPVQWANLRAGDREHVRIQARAAVSAALHDPDDPDWLARVIDPEAFGDAAFVPDPRSLVGMVLEGRRATARRRAANLVAAILGADS